VDAATAGRSDPRRLRSAIAGAPGPSSRVPPLPSISHRNRACPRLRFMPCGPRFLCNAMAVLNWNERRLANARGAGCVFVWIGQPGRRRLGIAVQPQSQSGDVLRHRAQPNCPAPHRSIVVARRHDVAQSRPRRRRRCVQRSNDSSPFLDEHQRRLAAIDRGQHGKRAGHGFSADRCLGHDIHQTGRRAFSARATVGRVIFAPPGDIAFGTRNPIFGIASFCVPLRDPPDADGRASATACRP